MGVPSVRLIGDAVRAMLIGAPLAVYDTVIPDSAPRDDAGRLRSLAVLHMAPGDTPPSNLAGQPGQLLAGFQVNCAGGDHDYAAAAVDLVRGRLLGKPLTVAGAKTGLIQAPLGFQGRPPMPVDDGLGFRLVVPLLFEVLAVSA